MSVIKTNKTRFCDFFESALLEKQIGAYIIISILAFSIVMISELVKILSPWTTTSCSESTSSPRSITFKSTAA